VGCHAAATRHGTPEMLAGAAVNVHVGVFVGELMHVSCMISSTFCYALEDRMTVQSND
jgi:hypothetical protein